MIKQIFETKPLLKTAKFSQLGCKKVNFPALL